MIIRKASLNEANLLTELAMRSKAYWGYSDEFMENCRDELTVKLAKMKSSDFSYFVGEFKGKIVGFYALKRISPTLFDLEAMFIEPEFIGSGFGRLLMTNAKLEAKKKGAETIKIQSDPNALPFYLAMGGVRTGDQESESIPGRFLPLLEIDLTGIQGS